MAQKGGRIPSGTDANRQTESPPPATGLDDNKGDNGKQNTDEASKVTTDVATRSDASAAPPQDQDVKSRDGEQWEVLPKPGEADDTSEGQEGGFSSHFAFKLGWGSWRTTIFSWDLKVGRRR
ncbi:hypothetical protein PG984_014469 [Apiospora sp. TS-2023a]